MSGDGSTWVERTLEEVVLVMKLACSNEVADRDDCGRTCVVDHNMRGRYFREWVIE